MKKFGEVIFAIILFIILAVYVVSPVDLVPGPIDDAVGVCVIGGEVYHLIKKD